MTSIATPCQYRGRPSSSRTRTARLSQPHDASVRADDPELLVEGLARLLGAGVRGVDALAIVRMHELAEVGRVRAQLLARDAEDLLGLRAEVGEPGLLAAGPPGDLDERDRRDLLDQGAVPLLEQPQVALGLLAVGDVDRHAVPEAGRAFVVADQDRAVVHPADLAVLRQLSELLVERLAGRLGPHVGLPDARQVVRVQGPLEEAVGRSSPRRG